MWAVEIATAMMTAKAASKHSRSAPDVVLTEADHGNKGEGEGGQETTVVMDARLFWDECTCNVMDSCNVLFCGGAFF
ncbi:hypothetical protein VOLCADRAFT_103985 [Volvox carteri f. nagariensis]|uniref:Uncharacterized protein n=1 Tax=Volvox carteri f. nagariensis TaxID=3068 RepID=D8TQH0_VOLCA|nr:uncharacterized protein VOLCADRAFT_103985 [Volvox carteri f. nagariensis]EFJ50150.1 hypothetical protein VOLCADRAFT_103985 [Volvox carteri f. nagariensis]|eukprot:XP_002948770.1 hypothetical protein VOLCADRAFT_103985 [Volvox carteri f. nagariensis]